MTLCRVLALSVALSVASAQLCQVGDMPSQCQCQPDEPGTFSIECSCGPSEALIISETTNDRLPATITSFQIHDCNESVTIMPYAFTTLNILENITFQRISHLILQSNSLEFDIHSQSNFMLAFDSVMSLSLEQNAIRLQRQGGPNINKSITIQNTFIKNLEENAISGSLSELHLEHVILSQAPGSKAINVGSEGASIFISFLDATNKGLSSEWITGNVSVLSITNSNLSLLPNAFAGVYMQGLPHSIFNFHNNQLGYPKWFPGSNGTVLIPSLPTGSLNLKLPSNETVVHASNNNITCSCEDIVWLQEGHRTSFKSKVQQSLKCIDGNITLTIAKCGAPSLASAISLSLTLTASWVLLALL